MGINIKLQIQHLSVNDASLNIYQINIKYLANFYIITINYNIHLSDNDYEQQHIPLYDKVYRCSVDEIPTNIESYCYNQLALLYS